LSRHERSIFERSLICPSKNHHVDKKIGQREARMGSYMS